VTVAPGWQPAVLRKSGTTPPLSFDVTPRHEGTVELHLSIVLQRELTLLEEFLLRVPVGAAAAGEPS
jgi:hypothetical protein